jgi:PKD repeat protein
MKRLILTLLVGTTLGLSSNAQEITKKCGHTEALEEVFRLHPELRDGYEAHELLQNSGNLNKDEKIGSYTIPVVFHVLHQYGAENIDDAQVYDALRVINEEFNSSDSDSVDVVAQYKALIGNGNIEFKLAAKDPLGRCTNGIEHIYTHETEVGDGFSKLHQWNRAKYLNIWVVRVISAAGAAAYAIKPAGTDGNGYYLDGIVSNHTYVGSTGTSSPFTESTLTHEIGHYLSLSHPWGDNNDPGVGCGDDGMTDTPQTKGHTSCPAPYNGAWLDCSKTLTGALATYTFDSIVPTSGMMDPTPIPAQNYSVVDPTIGIVFSNFTAVGVGANPTTTATFGFDDWDTGAVDGETVYSNLGGSINLSKYYEFTATSEFRSGMILDDLAFAVGRDMTGPRTFAVRWSQDGFATNMPLTAASSINTNVTPNSTDDVYFYNQDATTIESGLKVALGGLTYTSITPITFRIYAYNAEDAAGDFIVENVKLNGTFAYVEDVQNYMDYSYCDRHFTPDQINAMHNALEGIAGQRNRLWNDTTLMETGVKDLVLPQNPSNLLSVPLCIPVADFSANRKTTCIDQLVQFSDASWNATIDDWAWTFEGGTPASSTSMNPSVSFATPGYKTITLTVTNAAGSGTESRSGYVYISPLWADISGPGLLDLEDGKANWFIVNNPEENHAKFTLTNGTGFNSSRAFKLNNYKNVQFADFATDNYFYNQRLGKTIDELISPSFDLRYTTGVTVTFKYAYASNATQADQIEEVLKVYSSKNCGDSWTTRKTINGTDLVTAGYAGFADYTPSSNGEYVEASFTYVPTSADEHTRFKFEFEASDLSSNLYIDDIFVSGTLSLTSEEISGLDMTVYPNPTVNGEAIKVSYFANDNDVTFTLRDVQGKVLSTETLTQTNSEVNHTLKNSENLPAACYFLEVQSGDYTTTKKVVVM